MSTATIDSKDIQLEETTTILEAAKQEGIWIPTLCHNEHVTPFGGCRVCLVEVASSAAPERTRLLPACSSRMEKGLIVTTDSERVKAARRFVIELLLARCPEAEEIRELAERLGVSAEGDSLDVVGRYLLQRAPRREQTDCVLCSLCVRVCAEVTERHAISFSKRGIERKVKTPFDKVSETCIGCGSCAYVCPTNTITIEEAN